MNKYHLPKAMKDKLGTITISQEAIKASKMEPKEFAKIVENRMIGKKKKLIDATLRNVRAAKKRESKLEKKIKELENRIEVLERK